MAKKKSDIIDEAVVDVKEVEDKVEETPEPAEEAVNTEEPAPVEEAPVVEEAKPSIPSDNNVEVKNLINDLTEVIEHTGETNIFEYLDEEHAKYRAENVNPAPIEHKSNLSLDYRGKKYKIKEGSTAFSGVALPPFAFNNNYTVINTFEDGRVVLKAGNYKVAVNRDAIEEIK